MGPWRRTRKHSASQRRITVEGMVLALEEDDDEAAEEEAAPAFVLRLDFLPCPFLDFLPAPLAFLPLPMGVGVLVAAAAAAAGAHMAA